MSEKQEQADKRLDAAAGFYADAAAKGYKDGWDDALTYMRKVFSEETAGHIRDELTGPYRNGVLKALKNEDQSCAT